MVSVNTLSGERAMLYSNIVKVYRTELGHKKHFDVIERIHLRYLLCPIIATTLDIDEIGLPFADILISRQSTAESEATQVSFPSSNSYGY